MTPKALRSAATLLDSFGTLTLATQSQQGPWAAALFYARDEKLNLYFISDNSSRHVLELIENEAVAITVNGDHKTWKNIRGLQISGTAERVGPEERARVEELYLSKFADLKQLLTAPSTAGEQRIASEFRASDFFRVRPKTIRVIDNRKEFGHTEEILVAGHV